MTKRGVQDAIPLFIPAIPFAFVLGVAIVDSGINELTGWSSSFIVYAGAAQLTLVTLLGAGAVGAAIAAALVVNVRHVLYSLALAPAFQKQPAWFRWVGSALLIDQMFVLADQRKDDSPADFRRYYLSAALVFLIGWNVFVAVGLVVGPSVPADWSIAFAVPVMFTGMLIGGLAAAAGARHGTRRLDPKVVAAIVAAVTTVLAADLPHRSGLLVGAAAGIVAGLLAGPFAQRFAGRLAGPSAERVGR